MSMPADYVEYISPGALRALRTAIAEFAIIKGEPDQRLRALRDACRQFAPWVQMRFCTERDAFDAFFEAADNRRLMDELGEDVVSTHIMNALTEPVDEQKLQACVPVAGIDSATDENANNDRFKSVLDDEIPFAEFEANSPPVGDSFKPAAPLEFIAASDWPNEAPPPVSWVVSQKIPRGDVTTLDGDGGLGKTMAAVQLAVAVARGQPDWLGFNVDEQGPVLFLSAEEPEAEIHRRVWRIAARGNYDLTELADLKFWFPSDVGDCLLATQSARGGMEASPLFRSIADRVNTMRPALVVLDNIAAIFGGNQNDRAAVRSFMNLWRGLARSSGAAVLLLNHPSLSGLTAGTGRGGSMDWRNAVRAGLHLKPADDKADADRGVRVLECVKSNYAALGSPVRLEWIDGVLTPEGTASPTQRAAQDAQADEKFLALLDLHNRLGINVSVDGPKYAPKIFSTHPEADGYRKQAFATTMHRLLSAGRIVVETHGPETKQRKRLARAQ